MVISIASIFFAAQSRAQESTTTDQPSTEQTQDTADNDNLSDSSQSTDDSDEIEGTDVGTLGGEDVYYWDKREKQEDASDNPSNPDENLEDVIVAAGGLYNEEVIYRKDPKDIGDNQSTYTTIDKEKTLEITGWLPIRSREMEFDVGEQENCGLTEKIPLMSKSEYKSDVTVNVSSHTNNAYIDIIGDRKENDQDSFILSWYVAVHKDTGSLMATVPYDIADGVDTVSEAGRRQNINPYVIENGYETSKPLLDAGGNPIIDTRTGNNLVEPSYDYHKCEIIFKDNFNTTLQQYNPRGVDNSIIKGKILGKKGMKFHEWVRKMDNIRDYLAYEESARRVTQSFCDKGGFRNVNKCITFLSRDFHSCYLRSTGHDTNKSSNYALEYIKFFALKDRAGFKNMPFDYFKVDDLRHDPWMHTARLNTDAFVSCFSLGPEAKDSINVDLKSTSQYSNYFQSKEEIKNFALSIINGVEWPPSINPIFAEKEDPGAEAVGAVKTTCSLGKIGWLMCPIMKFLSKIADSLFKFLEGWMKIPPLRGDSDQAAYRAWVRIRDIGNVFFAILLMSVVVAQAAGGVFNRYNVKKMVPKLIVTAILINISFIITSLGVDISNVIGSSLISTIRSLSIPRSGIDGFDTWESITVGVAFAGGAAAGTYAVIASLAALLPMLITAVFSMLIVLLLLLLRQSLVIILIVIAPIAIATRMLPGTEKWYKKWKSMFIQTIMLYPAIALVFGGSYFASTVVTSSAVQQGGLSGALLAIFALSIQVLPLFISPIVLRLGGSVINSVGGTLKVRLAGAQNISTNAANSVADSVSDRLNTRAAQGSRFGGLRRMRMRRRAKKAFSQRELDRSQAKSAIDTPAGRFITSAVGGGLDSTERDKIKASLAAEAERVAQQDIKAAKLKVDRDPDIKNASTAAEANIIDMNKINDKSTDSSERIARMNNVVERGDLDHIHSLIDKLDQMSDTERRELAKAIQSSEVAKSAAHLIHPSALRDIANGEATVQSLYQGASRRGDYTSQKTASMQSEKAIRGMAAHLGHSELSAFKSTHYAASQNSKYSPNITDGASKAAGDL
ncbi:type IV secretion system protein [Candidatus Saccharibacteria bacterium]|nr:type IV secretion system protein [Candidatus Saccharibacteria bacterium]